MDFGELLTSAKSSSSASGALTDSAGRTLLDADETGKAVQN